MADEFPIFEMPPEILNRPPNKGGRPEGATDKIKSGRRNRPRSNSKQAVVLKAAEWHVANNVDDMAETVAKFFPEYSQGMTESDRHFKTQLAEAISKRSQ